MTTQDHARTLVELLTGRRADIAEALGCSAVTLSHRMRGTNRNRFDEAALAQLVELAERHVVALQEAIERARDADGD